jgi:diguanylate cyclase
VPSLVRLDQLDDAIERRGPAHGTALVASVVDVLRDQLRSYDPVVRVAADEFLCAMPGSAPADAHARMDAIRRAIADGHPPGAVSVGSATLTASDTLSTLVARAAANLDAP